MIIEANKGAADYIRGKAAIDPNRFRHLPNDVKAKGFTVAFVHNFDVLESLKNKIAKLPEGADWKKLRREVAADISPYMGGNKKAARNKAELLLRTHGFQAYAAGRYSEQMATKEAVPYLMYMTVGDGNVRDDHAALDGKVLPADDSFWDSHYPPWDFGCRCVVAGVTGQQAQSIKAEDEKKPPAMRRVLEGKALEDARAGRVAVDGRGVADVRPPQEKLGKDAYGWTPGEIAPDAAQMKQRLQPRAFKQLELELEKQGLELKPIASRARVNIDKAAGRLDGKGWKLGKALPYEPGQKETRYEMVNEKTGETVVRGSSEIKKMLKG